MVACPGFGKITKSEKACFANTVGYLSREAPLKDGGEFLSRPREPERRIGADSLRVWNAFQGRCPQHIHVQ